MDIEEINEQIEQVKKELRIFNNAVLQKETEEMNAYNKEKDGIEKSLAKAQTKKKASLRRSIIFSASLFGTVVALSVGLAGIFTGGVAFMAAGFGVACAFLGGVLVAKPTCYYDYSESNRQTKLLEASNQSCQFTRSRELIGIQTHRDMLQRKLDSLLERREYLRSQAQKAKSLEDDLSKDCSVR